MRRKIWKTTARVLGTCSLLLLFEAVSSNLITYAQLPETLPEGAVSSLDGCATSPACAQALGLTQAVASPTAAGTATTVTTSGGAATTSPGPFALIARLAGAAVGPVAWFLWTEPINDEAQKLAQKKYCTTNPNDSICVPPFKGGQLPILYNVFYSFHYETGPYTGNLDNQSPNYWPLQVYGPIRNFGARRFLSFDTYDSILGISGSWDVYNRNGFGFCPFIVASDQQGNPANYEATYGGCADAANYNDHTGDHSYPGSYYFHDISITPAQEQPDTGGDPPPPPWKDWPQDKRDAAVGLLTSADWDVFFKALQQSGELQPGEQISAPKTGIYGPDDKLRVLPGPYTNSGKPLKDSDIYKKLNPKQQQKLDKLLQKKNKQGENVYDEDILKNGKLTDDTRKCYTVELGMHLGGTVLHNDYAIYVTGSISDVLVVDQTGEQATFDGEIQPNSQAVLQVGSQTEGAMAEVKTGHSWLAKTLPPLLDSLSQEDKEKYLGYLTDLRNQLTRESRVANRCGLNFQIFFNEQVAADSAKQLSSQASLPIPLYSLINYIQYP